MYNIQGSYERPRVRNTTVKQLRKPIERFTNTTANPSKKPSKKPTNSPTMKPITFGDEKKIAEKSPYESFGGKAKYCSQRNALLSYGIKLMKDVNKNEVSKIRTDKEAIESFNKFKKKIEEHKKKMGYNEDIKMNMPGFDGQKLGECTQKKLDEAMNLSDKLGNVIDKNKAEEQKCKEATGPLSPYKSCSDKKAKERQHKNNKQKQKIMMIGGGVLLVLIVYFLFLRKK